MKPYSIVVLSCDAYHDLWPTFFMLMKQYWPDCSAPIILNTETLSYTHDEFNIVCPQLYLHHPNPTKIPWSKRLHDTLARCVKTELVLLLIEDYFFLEQVDVAKIDQCAAWMEADPRICTFTLVPCSGPFDETGTYPCFVRSTAGYRNNLQAGLWRRELLISNLRDHEDPWLFESFGSMRSQRRPWHYYSVARDQRPPILYPYGGFLWGGKWQRQYVERQVLPDPKREVWLGEYRRAYIDALASLPELDIDYSQRGYFDELVLPPNPDRGLKLFWRRLRKFPKIFRSLY